MAPITDNEPVQDTVAKVNNEFAVGSNPEFQQLWSRFERLAWILLLTFLLLSLAGVFGRGPLANATRVAADHSLVVNYERVQRHGTPSILTVDISAGNFHDGVVQLWVADALVKPLGNQRVIPQPLKSEISRGGMLYTFLAEGRTSASVEFQSQPSSIGRTILMMQVPGKSPLSLSIYVVP